MSYFPLNFCAQPQIDSAYNKVYVLFYQISERYFIGETRYIQSISNLAYACISHI